MNPHILKLQTDLGFTGASLDGLRGPATTAEILDAADRGALAVKAMAPDVEPPWVTEMKAVFGLHEERDAKRLREWLSSDGHTLGDPNVLPWCGDAVETAIRRALPDEPLPGALGENPYFARNWALFGEDVMSAPPYGAVGVFSRGPSAGHVGFLVGRTDVGVMVLGGNQGDSISVVQIASGRLLAARFPRTWGGPRRPLPKKVFGGGVSVNEA
jgi:uncharacterized protein (TIGR02594 family)